MRTKLDRRRHRTEIRPARLERACCRPARVRSWLDSPIVEEVRVEELGEVRVPAAVRRCDLLAPDERLELIELLEGPCCVDATAERAGRVDERAPLGAHRLSKDRVIVAERRGAGQPDDRYGPDLPEPAHLVQELA